MADRATRAVSFNILSSECAALPNGAWRRRLRLRLWLRLWLHMATYQNFNKQYPTQPKAIKQNTEINKPPCTYTTCLLKKETIETIDFGLDGFGSLKQLTTDARAKIETISYEDVRGWKTKQYCEQEANPFGSNHFIVQVLTGTLPSI